MIYHNVHPQIEAEAVTLAGERYYAVLLNGRPYLAQGLIFDLLFGPEIEAKPEAVLKDLADSPPSTPRPEVKRQARARKAVWSRDKKGRRKVEYVDADAPAPAPHAGEFKSPYLERALQTLQPGPLTHAELAGHVYPDLSSTEAGRKLHSIVSQLRERGLIEKREDPAAGGLMKWYAV